MTGLQMLLFPFAVLYDAVTSARNRLYDLGQKPSATFNIPVISVGNLSVGGTGKTPMIEHLIRMLRQTHKIATLSRGYKRQTRGFRIAGPHDDAGTIGDEPFQFYRKFGADVVVAVGEDRAMAIPQILALHPEVNVILLDDAFQHRKVKPAFQILLTDYHAPFFRDYLLPAGRLRESKQGANRADVIVVTKCPDALEEEHTIELEKEIRTIAEKPTFFTGVHYGEAIAIGSAPLLERKVVLVTGIANAEALREHVETNYTLIHHYAFPDHHAYSVEDLQKIIQMAEQHRASVLTTEKDAAKLVSPAFRTLVSPSPFFYLPIEIGFMKNGQEFDAMVLDVVNARKHA